MPDSKITALTNLTAADPINDMFPIVDVSDNFITASGTTKRISINNLLGASGTATLASATITGAATVGTTLGVTGVSTLASAVVTGDLTARTTGLILNTSGLGIGITPTSFGGGYGTIQVSGSTGAGIRMGSPTNPSFIYSDASFLNINTSTNIPHRFFVNNLLQYTIEQLGVFTWADGAGGTRMTLNSTGLGVGVVPTLEKLQVNGGIIISPPSTPATLGTNGQLTVNATSNTNLRFSYRGSDGTTRVANVTLA